MEYFFLRKKGMCAFDVNQSCFEIEITHLEIEVNGQAAYNILIMFK